MLVFGSALNAVDALVRVQLVNRILIALVIAANFRRRPVPTIILKVNYL